MYKGVHSLEETSYHECSRALPPTSFAEKRALGYRSNWYCTHKLEVNTVIRQLTETSHNWLFRFVRFC